MSPGPKRRKTLTFLSATFLPQVMSIEFESWAFFLPPRRRKKEGTNLITLFWDTLSWFAAKWVQLCSKLNFIGAQFLVQVTPASRIFFFAIFQTFTMCTEAKKKSKQDTFIAVTTRPFPIWLWRYVHQKKKDNATINAFSSFKGWVDKHILKFEITGRSLAIIPFDHVV